MFEIIGLLLGGGLRLVPEILKFFDRNNERKHEQKMFEYNLKADQIKADSILGVAELEGLVAATKAQAVKTGIKWVDAISALMRPLITFWWCIVLYTWAKVCQYLYILDSGVGHIQSMLNVWGPSEQAIVMSIISFWFVDRSLRGK
jgi:hypothetical protein